MNLQKMEATFRDATITPTAYNMTFTMVRNDRNFIVKCTIDSKIEEIQLIDSETMRPIYGVDIFDDALKLAKKVYNKIDFQTLEQPFYLYEHKNKTQ